MYERFTDRARKTLALANQEAQRFNHEYVGTEHILLGLVKEDGGVGASVLKNLDIDLRKVRLEVEKLVKTGPDMVTMGTLPKTPRSQKVLGYAIEEARNLNHNYVGTEHLLLGLLREWDGVAAQVLLNLGLKLEEVREEVLNLLGCESEPRPSIRQTGPISECDRAAELRSKIAVYRAQQDEALRNADYETAVKHRDEADALQKELDAIVVPCDKCPKRATVYIKDNKDGVESKVNLCEQCSALRRQAPAYTDVCTLNDEQLKQLFSWTVSPEVQAQQEREQPLLVALSKADDALGELLAVVASTELGRVCEPGQQLDAVVEVANFMKSFVKLRNRLIG